MLEEEAAAQNKESDSEIPMQKYKAYTTYLVNLVSVLRQATDKSLAGEIRMALDGGPGEYLRQNVSPEERRRVGAFFTNTTLSHFLLKGWVRKSSVIPIFCDPTCGAGDLLVACSWYLPLGHDLESTLDLWGDHLIGLDIHAEFVVATKARLVLAATERGAYPARPGRVALDKIFPKIRVANVLREIKSVSDATHVVLNPPYSVMQSPRKCSWAHGKVSKAAVFVESVVANVATGTKVAAILPDVLRSGERYKKWREVIQTKSRIETCAIYGRFDASTDIDVFTCHLVKGSGDSGELPRLWGSRWSSDTQKVGDYFEVHVGAVVPHRDANTGPLYPYITAKGLPLWKTVSRIAETRRFSGTVFSPPFVAVRRTSRGGDKFRARGTIINCGTPVAVENHLLVLQPRDGTLAPCKQLIEILNDPSTDEWLNESIRLRHLTLSSLRELPWSTRA